MNNERLKRQECFSLEVGRGTLECSGMGGNEN